MGEADGGSGRVPSAAARSVRGLRRKDRSALVASALVVGFLLVAAVGTPRVGAAMAPDLRGAGRAGPPRLGEGASTSLNGSNLNNTTSRLGNAIGSFVTWFVRGLVLVVGLVIGVLLVGGIVNYVVVGRKRGSWTPPESEGLRGREPPPGTSAGSGPPPGPGAP